MRRQGFVVCWVAVVAAVVAGSGCSHDNPHYRFTAALDARSDRFSHAAATVLSAPLVAGNQIDTLVNGDEIFPAMLESIRAAEHTITFETYVYWSGEIGGDFTAALCERAQAGVAVHVIIDAYGSSKISKDYLEQMRDCGVEVVLYHPLKWTHFINVPATNSLNFRTHRKLMVVDGKEAFIGGVGIADVWAGDAQDEDHWRDNHYRVRGPVVSHLQAAFLDNWIDTTGEVCVGETYFPRLEPAGDMAAQSFISSPESGGSRNMQLMYLMFIAGARESLYLATPYFVLDDQSKDALVQARQRGVDVKIITPRRIDQPVVRQASRAGWAPLLEAGIELYEFEPTMMHSKLMVVDDTWVSIGSANLDNRSFKLNDEANLNVRDPAFARQQRKIFEADLRRSERITLENYDRRSWHKKLRDGFASLLSPQL